MCEGQVSSKTWFFVQDGKADEATEQGDEVKHLLALNVKLALKVLLFFAA